MSPPSQFTWLWIHILLSMILVIILSSLRIKEFSEKVGGGGGKTWDSRGGLGRPHPIQVCYCAIHSYLYVPVALLGY